METLSTGMISIRVAQFFADNRFPTPDDVERLRDAVGFINRSLAGVRYLEAGETEGLEEDSLKHARYATRSLREVWRTKRSKEHEQQFRSNLQTLSEVLTRFVDDPNTPIKATTRKRLERFFQRVGEAMIATTLDSDRDAEDWPSQEDSAECFL